MFAAVKRNVHSVTPGAFRANIASLPAQLLSKGALKAHEGYPRGVAAVLPDVINRDLLDFLRT